MVLTATQGTSTLKQNLVVQTPQLVGISVGPTQTIGGSITAVTGTVSISGAAPSGGETIKLTSSSPATVKVPAYVKVLSGATSVAFPVVHKSVAASKSFSITAALGSQTSATTLELDPFQIAAISASPNLVTGGQPTIGTVTLNATPSSASGAITVKLTSSSVAAGVPATVSVSTGTAKKTFTVTTKAVSASMTASIVGKVGTSSQATGITIQQPFLSGISVKPGTVKGSAATAVTGTLTLSGIAPTGGLTVTLTSTAGSVAGAPTSVKVLAGKSNATFKVTHFKVQSQVVVTLTANLAGVVKTTTLTVTP